MRMRALCGESHRFGIEEMPRLRNALEVPQRWLPTRLQDSPLQALYPMHGARTFCRSSGVDHPGRRSQGHVDNIVLVHVPWTLPRQKAHLFCSGLINGQPKSFTVSVFAVRDL